MVSDYRGGYLKALIDLRNIINKYDLTFYLTMNRETRRGRLANYLCKSYFPTFVSFLINHTPELLTWGDYVEFTAKIGGKLEMVSKPNPKFTATTDYKNGYKQALKDIEGYFFNCEGRVTKKRIMLVIQEHIEEA